MRTIVVGIAGLVMALALLWAGIGGDLQAEGASMVEMRWGVVSLVEIYVGIGLFGGWVFARESSWLRAGGWMLGVILIGNLVSCIYVLFALREAKGDSARFWLGTERSAEPRMAIRESIDGVAR